MKYIVSLEEVSLESVSWVGGKNANLGEMLQQVSSRGIPIPSGFVLTVQAYEDFIHAAGLAEVLDENLRSCDPNNLDSLKTSSETLRNRILSAEFPPPIQQALAEAYYHLETKYGCLDIDVAVRSSATAEDLPEASFAGQQETFLNVRGVEALLDACKKCYASLFTSRAIHYRHEHGLGSIPVGMAIGVQKMVRSDRACSGVMFTLDPDSGFRDVCVINASWGLGELIVQGLVNPDEYWVGKQTLETHSPLVKKQLGTKDRQLIYDTEKRVREMVVPRSWQRKFCLTDEEIVRLARWGKIIEIYYTEKRGAWTPMDIEWAKDGITGDLWIVQARLETVQRKKDFEETSLLSVFHLSLPSDATLLCSGTPVGSSVRTGFVHVLKENTEMASFRSGEILVTSSTDPDWEPIMKRAAGIVTDRGGRTCHAAIVARELGIPCVVGCENATQVLKTGTQITLDTSGERGNIYLGEIPFTIETISLPSFPSTKTKICMNLANPELAWSQSFLPNQGVGLARMEFIINHMIQIHPMALLYPEKGSEEDQLNIASKIVPYASGKEYFVETLAQGVGSIACAFYPKPVILRFSDFKSDEYAALIGGSIWEPKEANPMLGWRGCSRYYSPEYREAFALECQAVKKVRERMGFDNLQVMIPFCRTPAEGRQVLEEMERSGLYPRKGLKIIVMIEIPSNVFLIDEFMDLFDGGSIGSNDLTSLCYGICRSSERIASLFDEEGAAVMKAIEQVISGAHRKGKTMSICGQGPSDKPSFAEALVRLSIDAISLTPDTLLSTTLRISEVEKKLEEEKRK